MLLHSFAVLIIFIQCGFADVYVIHSCSGAGKDTISAAVFRKVAGIYNVCRITTRPKRYNETVGVDMTFVNHKEFIAKEQKGEIFLKEIIGKEFYGGDRKRVQEHLDKKDDVVLIGKFGDIDKEFPKEKIHHILIDITKETQTKRLAARATESPQKQVERIARYESDMEYGRKYATFVLNNEKDCDDMLNSDVVLEFIKFIHKNREYAKKQGGNL
jgi:guanylate kinase